MAKKDKTKDVLIKTTAVNKNFNYQKNAVTLGFTLRIDNSSELRDFKACMQEAIKDIDELLKEMKN